MLRRVRHLPARVEDLALGPQAQRAQGLSAAPPSAGDLAARVASGDLSAVDAVDASLAAIERINPDLNAIVWVRQEARRDAEAAQARIDAGTARPLEGVPFTAKDLHPIADGPTNLGSRAFEGWHAGFDSEMVRRMRAAGAILVGTTAASEFGNRPTTETALFGATRNPWDPSRTCGGSSGGAAVAAATGIAPINLGGDGGGSIRVPAACTGVVGLKPSRARISLGPQIFEEWGGLVVAGALTPTVRDQALFLDLLAGPMPHDPWWPPPPTEPWSVAIDRPRRCRIAVAFERDGEAVEPETKAAVRATADALADLGHEIVEAQPDLAPLLPAYLTVAHVGIGVLPLRPDQVELLEPRTKMVWERAQNDLAVDYLRAIGEMHRHAREILGFWDTVDALLTPMLSRPAPPIGEIAADPERAWDDYRNWLCWSWPFNVTGQPALALPGGMSTLGVPIGVQLVGGQNDEATILMLGAQLASARPWRFP